jgi:hypothetical protein
MKEAQDLFEIEFDAMPPPFLDFSDNDTRVWRIDLDASHCPGPLLPDIHAQAFTLWLSSGRFGDRHEEIIRLIRLVLEANPFSTLQIVLEPVKVRSKQLCKQIQPDFLMDLVTACQAKPTYLDKFYALQPGEINGAKRLVVIFPQEFRPVLPLAWIEALKEFATLVWRDTSNHKMAEDEIEFPLNNQEILPEGAAYDGARQ